jgi:hypothetical protein
MHPVLSAQLANAINGERRRRDAALRRAARLRRTDGHERAPVQPGASRSLTSLRRLASAPRS